jgi:hypothetical protein
MRLEQSKKLPAVPLRYYALAVDLRTEDGFYAEAALGSRTEEAAI